MALNECIDKWKDLIGLIGDISDIIVPIILGLLALFWPAIQNCHRRHIFTKLIFRELREISPYPEQANPHKFAGWWEHCQKTFIHQKIFQQPNENRDFILSLDPDLVYYISQLWSSLEKHDWKQWDYCLEELNKIVDPPYKISKIFRCKRKICENRKKWRIIFDGYGYLFSSRFIRR